MKSHEVSLYTREQKKWAKPILKLLLQEIMAFLRTFWN